MPGRGRARRRPGICVLSGWPRLLGSVWGNKEDSNSKRKSSWNPVWWLTLFNPVWWLTLFNDSKHLKTNYGKPKPEISAWSSKPYLTWTIVPCQTYSFSVACWTLISLLVWVWCQRGVQRPACVFRQVGAGGEGDCQSRKITWLQSVLFFQHLWKLIVLEASHGLADCRASRSVLASLMR